MLTFDIKQFEHFFNERTLKRGLRLFEKGDLELIERTSGFEFHFEVGSKVLKLRKKGDKLLSSDCSCGETSRCVHLAAALFYFQQETLGIKVKNRSEKRKTKNLVNANPVLTYSHLKKAESERLEAFIRENKNQLSASQITAFLTDKKTIGLSDVYSFRFTKQLEPFLIKKKLDQEAIDKLRNGFVNLNKRIRKEIKTKQHSFFIDLALVKAFFRVFNLRFSGNESALFKVYYDTLNELELVYRKGLSAAEKKEWFKVTLASVESNRELESEAFLFFIPRYVLLTKSAANLNLLNNSLSKRVYKTSYTHSFDKLQIARCEIAFSGWKLHKTAFTLSQQTDSVEWIIARAELLFCKPFATKAFQLLESEYENIRTARKNYYNDYLNYILLNARKYNNHEVELKYLRESLVHRLFILEKELDRYLELIPENEHGEKLDDLIRQIRDKSQGYHFDKISMLLLRANKLDELVKELAKQNNKFNLVHEVALRKYPDCDPAFLTIYMKHLGETLRQDSIYNYQVKVFENAKKFLDLLPKEVVTGLIKKLLDQIGKTGHLYRYINEMYGYPFLTEHENY